MGIDVESLAINSSEIKYSKNPRKKNFHLNKKERKENFLPLKKENEKFLLGPIPWRLISAAGRASGKALQVYIAIWFLVGMSETGKVKVSNKLLGDFGVDRFAKGRALRALQEAGLITIEKSIGSSPIITLLDPDPTDNKEIHNEP